MPAPDSLRICRHPNGFPLGSRTCSIRPESERFRKREYTGRQGYRPMLRRGNLIDARIKSSNSFSRHSLSAIPQSRSCSPSLTPNLNSSPKNSSLSVNHTSSPSPPWQAWTLDQDFFKQVYDWNEYHPENTLDRILNCICTSIEQNKDIMELVPDGPIPFRGFLKALAHLVKLGAVNSFVSPSRRYTKVWLLFRLLLKRKSRHCSLHKMFYSGLRSWHLLSEAAEVALLCHRHGRI